MNSSKNSLKGKILEFHIIQSEPVTCLNRDDTGSPKSAIIGGVSRGRVSSQCWKREVRMKLKELYEKEGVFLGTRTKLLDKCLFDRMMEIEDPADSEKEAFAKKANACAKAVASAFPGNTLFFFANSEIEAIVNFIRENDYNPKALVAKKNENKKKDAENTEAESGADEMKKDCETENKENAKTKFELVPELKKAFINGFNPGKDGVDIALFGRMVATNSGSNVRGAVNFAHAITTHRENNEVDFFSAIDDLEKESQAAHIGTLLFNSGTYYRYVNIDLGLLAQTIGMENVVKAAENFTKALFEAIPSARQNTQTGLHGWDYARVLIREGQGLQASFEKPVAAANGGGYVDPSIVRLNSGIEDMIIKYGSMYGGGSDYIFGGDPGNEKVMESIRDSEKTLSEKKIKTARASSIDDLVKYVKTDIAKMIAVENWN